MKRLIFQSQGKLFFPEIFTKIIWFSTYPMKLWREIWENPTCGSTEKSKSFRSSHQRSSMKKGVLRNFAKFTGKYLCQSLFFNKVAGLRYGCFPVNFAKFLRPPLLENSCGRLLLNFIKCIFALIISTYVSLNFGS